MSADLPREAAAVLRHNAGFANHENPAFALAVADWLESVADRYDYATTVKGADLDHAVAISRAYLGSAS